LKQVGTTGIGGIILADNLGTAPRHYLLCMHAGTSLGNQGTAKGTYLFHVSDSLPAVKPGTY
jgi:hypothetical protein